MIMGMCNYDVIVTSTVNFHNNIGNMGQVPIGHSVQKSLQAMGVRKV